MTVEPLPDDLDQFITDQNDKLVKTSAERSEASFGLGCTLGILPVVLMIAILWIAGVLNLISGFLAVAMGLLALVGIAGLVAASAKARALRDTYRYHVKLEIDRYLIDHQLSRPEFDARAYELLAEGEPLRSHIQPPQAETISEEEHAS